MSSYDTLHAFYADDLYLHPGPQLSLEGDPLHALQKNNDSDHESGPA